MKLQPPKLLMSVCQRLKDAGARTYLVGGCVRDMVLGLTPKDFDLEVYGLDVEQVQHAIAPLGRCETVGKSFGVIKLWAQGIEIDVALPRREKKTGAGHRGFDVQSDPNLDPRDASSRRDFTINAMMFDVLNGEMLDFHGGRKDLEAGILRHISPAFAEDPLRVLRAMQLAARFNLELTDDTAGLCLSLLQEANTLAVERIWAEWKKWAMASYPSRGLVALEKSGWLVLYPELTAMRGCPQDEKWHPEGDVWTHTSLVVDMAAQVAERYEWKEEKRLSLIFAALCHDIGKPETTLRDEEGRIRSPEHCVQGVDISQSFLKRIGAPTSLIQSVAPLVREHMTHMHGDPTRRAVRRLSERLEPVDIELWEALVETDSSGRPPYPASRPALPWLQMAEEISTHQGKPKPIVTGEILMRLDMQPGPTMGKVIQDAYEAQLDGDFGDEKTAVAWCKAHLSGL